MSFENIFKMFYRHLLEVSCKEFAPKEQQIEK